MAKGWGCASRGKTTKRFAAGGFTGYGTKTNEPVGRGGMGGSSDGGISGGVNAGDRGRGGSAGGVTTGNVTGPSATNKTNDKLSKLKMKMDKVKAKAPMAKPKLPAKKPMGVKPESMPAINPRAKLAYEDMGAMFKREGTGTNWPGQGRGPMTRTAPVNGKGEPPSRAAPGKSSKERD